jgi:hypothetical protein
MTIAGDATKANKITVSASASREGAIDAARWGRAQLARMSNPSFHV